VGNQLDEALAGVLYPLEVAHALAHAIADASGPQDVESEVNPLDIRELSAAIELDLGAGDDFHDFCKALALLHSLGFAKLTKQDDGSNIVVVLAEGTEPAEDVDFADLERELRAGRAFDA
jgi:hypothetical protein